VIGWFVLFFFVVVFFLFVHLFDKSEGRVGKGAGITKKKQKKLKVSYELILS